MNDGAEVAVAVLQQRVEALEESQSETRKDVKWLRSEMSDLVAGARILKWIIGVALPAGPSLGVVLAKLFGVG